MKSEIDEFKIIVGRMDELEQKAERLYLEQNEWEYIKEMLSEEERKEYSTLMDLFHETDNPPKVK